jgi:sugar transferase (PEP-CTERM/EpsH1 system associated)
MPGSPRLFSLCRGLSKRHQLTLVTPCQSPERYQAFLSDPLTGGVFKEVVILPDPPPVSDWWGRQLHRLRQEAHFVTRYRRAPYHAEVCRAIRHLIAQQATDILYLDGLPMAQYVMGIDRKIPAVIDLHDCLTLLYSRTMRVEKRWLRKLALYAETRSIARWEKSLSRVFSVIIVNSEVDKSFLKKLDPSANTLTIGNGVDSEFFCPKDGDKDDISKLIFTGVMNYGPNEDAAIYFCEAILPRIQERYPYVEFWAVGQDPSEKVQALARRPGVHVTGGVPDIRPYLESAGIFVCPLRYGAGVKNKLLAALAMRKAVVATSLSVEGLGLRGNEDLLVADEPEQFAEKVVALLENPAYAKRLGQSGQEFVRRKYSWESSAELLENALQMVAIGGKPIN